ncbi:MAG TPA: YetF domain-containing protein [Burkholderiales bacterium]|nr:YetF domain-containing protein [Burkholderiales bacterium]
MNWNDVFGLNVSPAELIVRGTAMYLFLFLLFRVVIRRRVGSVGMADILVLVIIADAAQNGMSGEYRSVTEGAILVTTIIVWNVLTDWLTYKSSRLQKILEPPPLLLIDNGRVLRRNLRVEFVSEDELRSKLREHGVSDYAQVAKAYMESDGEISVIKRQKRGQDPFRAAARSSPGKGS